jgi:hypothetical protein
LDTAHLCDYLHGIHLIKPVAQSRIHDFVVADPSELIRIYSYQDVKAWEAAQERGYLTGNHDYCADSFYEYPYEWMRRQMNERIENFSGDLPMWAWLKRKNGKKQPKDPHVRITALVPRSRILASCYDLWHHPLNNAFVSLSDAEYSAYDSQYPVVIERGTDPVYQTHTERHWETVFDIKYARSGYMLETYGFLDRIQLCVDRIYLREVHSVRMPDIRPPAGS